MSREDDRREILSTKKKRLAKLKQTQALFGSSTDPAILIEISEIEKEIKNLQRELGQFQPNTQVGSIHILFAILAMTKYEAAELETEDVFSDEMVAPVERKNWHELKRALQKININNLDACYGEYRHDWKPLINGEPIHDVIQNVANKLNASRRSNSHDIYPELLSGFLSSNDRSRRDEAWHKLESYGGILIIDALSMYHPRLREAALRSQLIGSSDRIGVIVIPPTDDPYVNRILEDKIYTTAMAKAFARYKDHWDQIYEFDILNFHILCRRLSVILRSVGHLGLSQTTRLAIYSERGQPKGMGSWVLGGGL